jgi:hypothetical protein
MPTVFDLSGCDCCNPVTLYCSDRLRDRYTIDLGPTFWADGVTCDCDTLVGEFVIDDNFVFSTPGGDCRVDMDWTETGACNKEILLNVTYNAGTNTYTIGVNVRIYTTSPSASRVAAYSATVSAATYESGAPITLNGPNDAFIPSGTNSFNICSTGSVAPTTITFYPV